MLAMQQFQPGVEEAQPDPAASEGHKGQQRRTEEHIQQQQTQRRLASESDLGDMYMRHAGEVSEMVCAAFMWN